MISWLQHSPRLKRAPGVAAWRAFATAPSTCEEHAPQPPAKRRWHVDPSAPAAHRLFIFITPYSGGNVVPDPMKGK
jgi:hypothetical protein